MTTESDVRATIIEELTRIAPDLDPSDIRDDGLLHDDYDLDSMDSFNLAAAIHQRLGVNIPDTDFARLQSVGDLVRYLAQSPQA
ncbi:MAG: acyl carrier protein [Saccharospirillum sp.]